MNIVLHVSLQAQVTALALIWYFVRSSANPFGTCILSTMCLVIGLRQCMFEFEETV